MNKEELKNIVLEILGSSDNASFNRFLSKIASSVKGSQALKLDGIGHFQLKKEPLSRMERKIEGNASEKDILLFLPEGEVGEDKIIPLEFEKEPESSKEFNESVFDVRIDEPTIITNPEDEGEEESVDDSLLNKIDDFVASGTVIDDYELLNEKGDSTRSAFEEESNEDVNNDLDDDFILSNDDDDFTEAEINKEFLNSDATDDYEYTSSDVEPEITEEDISASEADLKEDNVEEPEDSEDKEEVNPFDELDNYIKDETEDEAQEIIDAEPIDDEKSVEEISDTHETEVPKAKSTMFNNEAEKKWYKNPILYIATLSVIIAAGILFYFLTSEPEKVTVDDSNTLEVNTNKEENNNVGLFDSSSATESTHEDMTSAEKEIEQPKESEVVKKKADEVNAEKEIVKETENLPTGLYRDIKNDQSITSRIYFDGKRYTVQASSWKSKTIAEREVNKLRKKGYDAFIYKVFIKSKNGTWHRVRIGYFNSRKEAEEFLKKNKI